MQRMSLGAAVRIALAASALLPWLAPWAASIAAQEAVATVGRVRGAEGVPIAYEVRGTGSVALVLVHGWSCDRSYWAHQLEALSRDFTVVAVDLGGHGESGVGRENWTIESFGEDVAAVVNALDLQRVILVGHSMGGDVVPEAARRLPGRVLGLVWVDAYKALGPGRAPEEVQAFVARFRPHFADTTRRVVRGMFLPTSDPALVDRVATDMAAAPPAVALPALESAFGYSRAVTGTLGALKVPVIAINPDNEPTDVASMNRHGVEVMIMPGVGHFPHLEQAEQFNALLRRAIERIRS